MIPFVGRQQELARLSALFEQLNPGPGGQRRGRHVLVTGEAGIGKTRLVEEFTARARGLGARVLRGRCWDVGDAPAYWPWTQVFETCLDELGPEALMPLLVDIDPVLVRLLPRLRHALPVPREYDESTQAVRLRFFEAVSLFLRRLSLRDPLVLVLDDLEAADEPTLQLLRFLVRSGVPAPYMLLGLHRSPVAPSAPAAALLDGLACDPTVTLVRLQGLELPEIEVLMQTFTRMMMSDAAAEMSPARRAMLRALQVRTGGNPLFAVEFMRLYATGAADLDALATGHLPEGVRSVIGQRLRFLPADCREALAIAAVVGMSVELPTLATVAEVSTEVLMSRLGPAFEARLLVPSRGHPLRCNFSHPLVRETLCAELPPAGRAELHARIAEVLRGRFAATLDDHLDAIASHYVAALPVGSAALAVEFCRRAAARASCLAARDEALRFLERALEVILTLDDPNQWCEVALELGDAQTRAGHVREARATFLRVFERAEALGRPVFLARAALGFGGRFVWTRTSSGSPELRMLERALAALPDDQLPLRARVLARISGLHRDRRRSAENAERCREALELARKAKDHPTITVVLNALALHEMAAGTPQRMLDATTELLAVERATGDLELELQAHDYRAIALIDAGDTLAAEDEIAICERLAERLAQPAQAWFAMVARGQLALMRGELARAEELAAHAYEVGQDAQPAESRYCHLVQLYHLRREQGRLPELAQPLEDAVAPLSTFPAVRYLRAHLAAETGRHDEARGFLDGLVESAFASIHDSWQFRFMLAIASEIAFRVQHLAAAVILLPLLAAQPQRHLASPPSASAGAVRRYTGLLSATLGRRADALLELEQAAQDNRAAGAVVWALRCDLDRARLLASDPDDSDCGRLARQLAESVQATASAILVGAAVEAAALATEGAGDEADSPASFLREGEFWTISWHGRSLRLRDGRGLQYLGQLLASAGQELAAVQLVASVGGLTPGAVPLEQHHGPTLDVGGRAAVARRHAALTEALREAEAWNDLARITRLGDERAALARELAASVGLGGRDRRFADPGERARQSVTKAIKTAIRRIASENGELGRHLDSTVHTGFFCRYEPDPLHPPIWKVGL